MKKTIIRTLIILVVAFSNACKDSPTNGESDLLFTTNIGTELTLDGIWESGCAEDMGRFGSEIFRFSENSLVIDITFYSDIECATVSGKMVVEIEFEVDGIIEAELNGETVIANKISGIQRIDAREESFRQTLFVEEANTGLQFYHARFEEDGGNTLNGYPTDIIPIPFQKVSE